MSDGRPSLRLAFEPQRHRFRAPEALAGLVSDARARLDADDRSGLALAKDVLEFAPYDLDLHRALARYHGRAGDVEAMRPHVEVELDLETHDAAWVSATFAGLLDPPRLASLAAEVAAGWRHRCRTADLWFTELAPGEGFLTLRWPDDAQPKMVEAYRELLTHVRRVEARLFGHDLAESLRWVQDDAEELASPLEPSFGKLVGTFGHYGRVVATLQAFAAHVDDVRFFLFDQSSLLDEVWIVDGVFHLRRHPVFGWGNEPLEHLHWLYVTELERDDALRRYLISEWRGVASACIAGVQSPLDTTALASADRAMHRLQVLGDEPVALQAQLELARGHRVAGLRGLRRAIVDQPEWREGRLRLARELIALRAHREALSFARQALAFGYRDDSALLCCLCLEALGDHAGALAELSGHVARSLDNSPGVLLREADELVEQGLLEAASVVYRGVLALPRYADAARSGLARCEARDPLALEVLLPRAGDPHLRLEVSRALTERGDPLGELIRAQSALADAETLVERRDHRARVDALIADLDVPWADADLIWERGFVRSAMVPRNGPAVVARLLGCSAGRLLEELVVGLVPGEEAALVQALHARPRPSSLLRVYLGGVEPTGRWVVRAERSLGIGAQELDLAILPWLHVGHGELMASLTFDRRTYKSNLEIEQVPVLDDTGYGATLRLLPDAGDAVAALSETWTDDVQRMLRLDDDRTRVTFYQGTDYCYAGLDNLYGALRQLAPFVRDNRFVVFEDCCPHVDEVTITAGELHIVRGIIDDDDDAIEPQVRAAFLFDRHVERPEDDDWRRYVARHHLELAAWVRSPRHFRPAFDRVVELDTENADWFRLRGERAFAKGNTDEAIGAFRRAAALGGPVSVRGIVAAIVDGRDGAAAEQLGRFVVEHPDHTGGRWLAGFLGVAEASPHLEPLLGVVQQRLGGRDPLEPSLNDLEALNPRFEELVAWLVAATDSTPIQLRPVAAAYLCQVAGALHRRRSPPALVDRVYAAAAALDPRGGDVFVEWARMASGRAQREQLLEQALSVNPDHREALRTLGQLLYDAGQHARVIEVLGRYRELFDKAPSRTYGWALDLSRLADAYYLRACVALHGVPAGADWVEPPGPDALDSAAALLERGLEVLAAYFSGDSPRHAAFYTVMAQIAAFRKDDEGALAWIDRARAHPTPHAWSTRASSLNNLGRLDEAVDSAMRALELDANHWHSDYVLACVAAKRGAPWGSIAPRIARVLKRSPAARSQLAREPDLESIRPQLRALLATGTLDPDERQLALATDEPVAAPTRDGDPSRS